MPNYIYIIGACFPNAEAYTTGDPTIYNDLIWVTTPIAQAVLDASECAVEEDQPDNPIPYPDKLSNWHDVQEFGAGGSTGNKFLELIQSSLPSNESSIIMLGDGQIVHATIDTTDSPSDTAQIKIFKDATKGGSGRYAGGTQVGATIDKAAGSVSQIISNLSGYAFLAGDRISVYVQRNPDTLKGPVVKLFIRYN